MEAGALGPPVVQGEHAAPPAGADDARALAERAQAMARLISNNTAALKAALEKVVQENPCGELGGAAEDLLYDLVFEVPAEEGGAAAFAGSLQGLRAAIMLGWDKQQVAASKTIRTYRHEARQHDYGRLEAVCRRAFAGGAAPPGRKYAFQTSVSGKSRIHHAFASTEEAKAFLYAYMTYVPQDQRSCYTLFEASHRKVSPDDGEPGCFSKLVLDVDCSLSQDSDTPWLAGILPVPPAEFTPEVEPVMLERHIGPLVQSLAAHLVSSKMVAEEDARLVYAHVTSRHKVELGVVTKLSYHITVDVASTRVKWNEFMLSYLLSVAGSIPADARYLLSGSTRDKDRKHAKHVELWRRSAPETALLAATDMRIFHDGGQPIQTLFSAKRVGDSVFKYRGTVHAADKIWFDVSQLRERRDGQLPPEFPMTLRDMMSPLTVRAVPGWKGAATKGGSLAALLANRFPHPSSGARRLSAGAAKKRERAHAPADAGDGTAEGGGADGAVVKYEKTEYSSSNFHTQMLCSAERVDWVFVSKYVPWLRDMFCSDGYEPRFVSCRPRHVFPRCVVDAGVMRDANSKWFHFGLQGHWLCPVRALYRKRPHAHHHDSNSVYVLVVYYDDSDQTKLLSAFQFMSKTGRVRVWVHCEAECPTERDGVPLVDLTRCINTLNGPMRHHKYWVEVQESDITRLRSAAAATGPRGR